MRIQFFLLAPLFYLIVNQAQASDFSAGVIFGSSNGFFETDHADTESETTQYYGFLGAYDYARNQRWSLGVESYGEKSFRANGNSEGFKVSRVGVWVSHDHRWILSNRVKPYIGLGLMYSSYDFKSRFLTDAEGFYTPGKSDLADKTESDFAGLISVEQLFELHRKIRLRIKVRYEMSQDTFNGYSLSTALSYQF